VSVLLHTKRYEVKVICLFFSECVSGVFRVRIKFF